MAIDSNDNYIHNVSENTAFTFVDFIDLKIFKFKSQKLFWGSLLESVTLSLDMKCEL